MTLSYIQAFHALSSGTISFEDYLNHLLSRFTGAGHEDDHMGSNRITHHKLEETDAFGYKLWRASEQILPKPEEVDNFRAMFIACRWGDLDEVRKIFARLKERHAEELMYPLALLALRERRATVLRFCLESDYAPKWNPFERLSNKVFEVEDPETYRVIEESQFRELHPRRCPTLEKWNFVGEDDFDSEDSGYDEWDGPDEEVQDEAAAAFDVGGSHPVDW